jgi:hypothetical protein
VFVSNGTVYQIADQNDPRSDRRSYVGSPGEMKDTTITVSNRDALDVLYLGVASFTVNSSQSTVVDVDACALLTVNCQLSTIRKQNRNRAWAGSRMAMSKVRRVVLVSAVALAAAGCERSPCCTWPRPRACRPRRIQRGRSPTMTTGHDKAVPC